ncbi:glycosyltransferase [Brevibacillus dissolubilis]|uniref:glycosyltransferase n=1 Tax=Brevibacillus dissolubilis TaxID=1844116 RepID=UPI001115F18C|nr:glycosyltransferase [Brevibacillus dissolubilis]
MNRKLRVLHVIGGGEFGGAEQHILNLLSNLPKDRVDAKVVCFYDSLFAQKLREAGIAVSALHQYGRFDWRLYQGLKQEFRDFSPDLIHTHGVKANFVGRLAARGTGTVLATTVHSNLRYDYVNPLAYTVASMMERVTRGWNHHYIAVSAALRDILVKEGVSSKKISVIYNGMDLAPFLERPADADERKAALYQEWGVPVEAFVFGTVARFVQVKGLSYMIEAFAQLDPATGTRPNHLVLVGDGPERASLEALSASLGVSDRVHFPGFRQDIPDCMRAFDLFVHSSIYEGLGYTIIEAMASGIPVIASDVGGVKEMVTHQQDGLLTPPAKPDLLADAMRHLSIDLSLQEKLVQEALTKTTRSFTIQQMADDTLTLYTNLIEMKK